MFAWQLNLTLTLNRDTRRRGEHRPSLFFRTNMDGEDFIVYLTNCFLRGALQALRIYCAIEIA